MDYVYIVFGSNDYGGGNWNDIPLCAYEDAQDAVNEVEAREKDPNKQHHIYFYKPVAFQRKK